MNYFSGGMLTALLLANALAGEAATPGAGASFHDCAGCPQMRVIPADDFDMGSAPGVAEGNGDESPVHRVKFSAPFAVGVNEVTRAEFARFAIETALSAAVECQVVRDEQWQTVKGLDWKNPGFAQTVSDPLVCVNWHEAMQYVDWLSRKAGRTYRLPSEAEWEYLAARAGAGHALSHEVANYGAEACCAGRQQGRDVWEFTAPAGSFPADASGLNDVLGNVWEWLADCYHENYQGAPANGSARVEACVGKRVVRGGSYGDGAPLLRPAYRLRAPEEGRYATLGFRVARDLD